MTQEPELSRLEELFQAAADLPRDERDGYLARVCGADVGLRGRLDAMLAKLEGGESLWPHELADSGRPSEGPGSIIGRYKLLQKIGEGGFGVVYMAEQSTPVVRKVALKVIKLGMDTKEVVARFEAERQALALMDHAGIAKVLDGGATETGRPYFVMELVRGISITEYCDKNHLGARERIALFADVCLAIQHAHQKGVIHRDIKPTNVLVTLHDGRPVPKVIDFGIAKAMHTKLTEKTLFTEFQRFLGTPAYMSPEQAEMSALDVDTRADIYSLGVLLYELLTGSTPFDTTALLREGMSAIQRAIREERPERPSLRVSTHGDASVASRRSTDLGALRKTLRGDLDWIVMKAIEKDRERRYGTASDLASDVRRHLEGVPVLAGPPSALYRARKFLARNRAAVIGAAVVVLALVAGAVGAALGLLEASRQRDVAQHEALHAGVALDFLVDTLSLTDPEVALDPDVSVKTLLDRASLKVAGAFPDRPLSEARVRTMIGRAYASLSEHEQAEAHLRRAVEILDAEGVQEPLEYHATLWQLTNILFALQRPDAFEVALKTRKAGLAYLGEEHQELAELLDRFVNQVTEAAYGGAPAALEAAQALFTQSVTRTEAELEPDDPRGEVVAVCYMAAALTGWYSAFEPQTAPWFAEALAIQRRLLPPEHPEIAKTLTLLVGVLTRAGLAEEAERQIRESVRIVSAVYPEGSFPLAFARSMLGQTLVHQGRFAEAEEPLVESHAVLFDFVDGDETNFYLVDSLARLVELYDAWGRPEAAQPYREALQRGCASSTPVFVWQLARFAFEPEHAPLVEAIERTQALFGALSFAVGAGQAEIPGLAAELDTVLEQRRRFLPDDHPLCVEIAHELLRWTNTLAPGIDDASRARMAEEALAILRAWEHVVPLDAADALAQLAEMAIEAGDVSLATSRAHESWDLVRAADGIDQWTDQWITASARVRVARCYVQLELFDQAEALLVPAHAILASQLGATNADTVAAAALLVDLYTRSGRPEMAVPYR